MQYAENKRKADMNLFKRSSLFTQPYWQRVVRWMLISSFVELIGGLLFPPMEGVNSLVRIIFGSVFLAVIELSFLRAITIKSNKDQE